MGDQGYPQAHNYPTQEVTAPLGGYPVEGAETGVSAGEQGVVGWGKGIGKENGTLLLEIYLTEHNKATSHKIYSSSLIKQVWL